MNTQQFVIEQYSRDDSLQSYRQITLQGLWKEEKEVFAKYVPQHGRILDLGCGTGRVAFNLVTEGQIFACDIVPAMIDTANALKPEFANQPEFSVQDGRQMSYPDAYFDTVIFAYNGVNTVPGRISREQIFAEVNRVLKDDGIFIFASHVRKFWKRPFLWTKRFVQTILRTSVHIREFGDNINEKYGRPQYINVPSHSDIERLVASAGFKIVEEIPTDNTNRQDGVVTPPRGTSIFVCKKAS